MDYIRADSWSMIICVICAICGSQDIQRRMALVRFVRFVVKHKTPSAWFRSFRVFRVQKRTNVPLLRTQH